MNNIRLAGQAITCTNYTTPRLFNFGPDSVQRAARTFLAAGVADMEIPQGVLDPEGKFPETGIDREALAQTVAGLPEETRVVGTYLGSVNLGVDNAAFLRDQKRAVSHLIEAFPDLCYSMISPVLQGDVDADCVREHIQVYGELAEHAAAQRPGFQLCFHNHYDTTAETAEQVRMYLSAIEAADLPSLRWGPDTGHCHGMGDAYLDVLNEYAHLIGNAFHIKARVSAFDQLHGGEAYRRERDIWNNEAERGRGLYSGFVNVADPEMETPFSEVFRIIRSSARPTDGTMYGAFEIDIPRQHPLLETLCSVLYLKNVHGIETGLALSNDEIIRRVFH